MEFATSDNKIGESPIITRLRRILRGTQLVIGVDRSGSMALGCVDSDGISLPRHQAVEEKLVEFLTYCFQIDGEIPVIFFNNTLTRIDVTQQNLHGISQYCTPSGGTNTHEVIRQMYEIHKMYRDDPTMRDFKRTIGLIITDGAPSYYDRTEATILQIAGDVKNSEEFNINFIQVGNDEEASKFLEKMDNLIQEKEDQGHGKKYYDIIDTSRFNDSMCSLEAFMKMINKTIVD